MSACKEFSICHLINKTAESSCGNLQNKSPSLKRSLSNHTLALGYASGAFTWPIASPLKQWQSYLFSLKRARVEEEDTPLPPATPGPQGANRQVLVNTAVFGLYQALLIERVISAVCCCYLCCVLVVQNVNKCESWLPQFVCVSISVVLFKTPCPLPFHTGPGRT